MSNFNPSRLFNASCFALITTAFAFAIRAGILKELATDFNLTDTQLGYINQMVLGIGFPIATIAGGLLYNQFGAKRMMMVALLFHVIGILLTIFANGFEVLLLSSFFIGFGNGSVEAACNPMIAAMYRDNKTTMLNRFHVWFPGGIFLGALISQFMSGAGMGWQAQIAVMLIPTAVYAYLFWGQTFPQAEDAGQAKLSDNIKGMLNPLYLFMLFCMILTANTELSTQQWVERLLGSAGGAQPMLILAMTTGLMAVGRYFAGPVVHRFNPTGVLWGSAIIAFIGIYLMSQATGSMTYVAAIMFAIGVCYFWPTMLGFTGEYIPKSGALGMSIMGGMGMFATGIAQPIVGGWLDKSRAAAQAQGLTGDAAELAAGQHTLTNLLTFPAILIVAFGLLWFYMRGRKHEA
ncbi:MAG: MFS transporter [Saprospiraceae bacterium]|nr:MFS transporter [Saprospiraceae bacterium]